MALSSGDFQYPLDADFKRALRHGLSREGWPPPAAMSAAHWIVTAAASGTRALRQLLPLVV